MSTLSAPFERFFTRVHARKPRPHDNRQPGYPIITRVVADNSRQAAAADGNAATPQRAGPEPGGYDLTAF